MAVLPLLALVPPLVVLVVLLLKRPRRKRRKRVRSIPALERYLAYRGSLLTPGIEKEESDDDMGFGLFD